MNTMPSKYTYNEFATVRKFPIAYGKVSLPISYGKVSDRSEGYYFDFIDNEGYAFGALFQLAEGEEIISSTDTVKLVGGRFEKFVQNKKYRFKVIVRDLDEDSEKEINEHFASIAGFVSDQWSFIPLQTGRYTYDLIFYFRRKDDALLFKMKYT